MKNQKQLKNRIKLLNADCVVLYIMLCTVCIVRFLSKTKRAEFMCSKNRYLINIMFAHHIKSFKKRMRGKKMSKTRNKMQLNFIRFRDFIWINRKLACIHISNARKNDVNELVRKSKRENEMGKKINSIKLKC